LVFALRVVRIKRRGSVCLNCGLKLGFEREGTQEMVRGSEKGSG